MVPKSARWDRIISIDEDPEYVNLQELCDVLKPYEKIVAKSVEVHGFYDSNANVTWEFLMPTREIMFLRIAEQAGKEAEQQLRDLEAMARDKGLLKGE
jgi:hypothetical protein